MTSGSRRTITARAGCVFPDAARCLLGALLLLAAPALPAQPVAASTPEKVLGPAACAECHPNEIEAWKTSKHFKSLHLLHRTPEATDIVTKLGLQPMKTEASCMACHYLTKTAEEGPKVMAAIACESCHSAAADWVKSHADYGVGGKKETETAEHRTARRAGAILQGMISHDDLYALGRNCYSCHVLQDEKLANVGGHVPGSVDFNFFTWSQGEVRHNVLGEEHRHNPEATPDNKRRLLAIGWILETEFSLRATALATEKATYGVTYARRADAARKMLEKIQGLAPTPQLAAILEVVRPVKLKLNNAAELNTAADRLKPLGRAFADQVTGAQLAALDALLPAPDTYKGVPFQLAVAP
jgi:hypothetical protein